MVRVTRKYGWNRDRHDERDVMFSSRRVKFPPRVDLSSVMTFPLYDQLNLGSCTAQAIAAHLEFNQIKQGKKKRFAPSRLFIYYNERAMEGTVNEDSGAEIRDGIKSVNKLGAPAETLWPYTISQFKVRPPKKAYADALKNQTIAYQRVSVGVATMKACLAQGYPFVCGFTVFESFESTTVERTGIVPMPEKNEYVLGGHAVLCVGYDDATSRFKCRNSYGKDWGLGGYFEIPYAFLGSNKLANDFWTIRSVE